MVKVNKQTLLSKFEQGMKPSQQDFADFIESTYTISDIEFYSAQGLATQPVKFLAGITTVTDTGGIFEVKYNHIPHSGVIVVIPVPIHNNVLPDNDKFVISANILLQEQGRSVGRAFLSGDNGQPGAEYNAPAPIGSRIQYFVILV